MNWQTKCKIKFYGEYQPMLTLFCKLDRFKAGGRKVFNIELACLYKKRTCDFVSTKCL